MGLASDLTTPACLARNFCLADTTGVLPKRLSNPADTPDPAGALRRLPVVTAAYGAPGSGGQPQVRASRVPTPDEDKEVMHEAFMNAYGQSHHGPRIKGMQEFAGAVSACGAGGCLSRQLARGQQRAAASLELPGQGDWSLPE